MDNDMHRRVLLATSISYVIVILDTSIVNVALERIAASLAGGVAGLQWVVTAYTLTFASLLLAGGTFGDRLGARNVYIAGLTVFTVASALCGAAPNLAVLVGGRAFQGLGAALLVPASMALINNACPDPRRRAAAFGIWAGLGGAAMACGPLVGGMLIALIGWRSIFLVNVPVCIIGIALCLRVRADTAGAELANCRRFDIAGQFAGIAALALLNIAVIDAPHYGWTSAAIIGCLGAALVVAALFIAIEARHAQPMMPLDLFSNAVFSGAACVSMVSAFTFYGLIFSLSLLLQRQLGYTPLVAGIAFLPLTIVVPVGSFLSKRAAGRIGTKWLVVSACLLSASGYLGLMALGPAAPYALLALPLPAIGFAASLITPVTTAAMMASVERNQAGIAAGVLNAARQTGAALGVASSGAFIARHAAIGDGMHAGLLFSAVLSLLAGAVWWRASTRSGSIDAFDLQLRAER
ncbi:MFS transporter [Paraburkholderia dilworthii]|uniref:MFS transporter n=1 Tax=Paraburkholderia dilworthii TaxID=948106 RepID=UPI0004244DA6|nr:MFS transporter [Paraburkholderia dilworthii]